MDFGAASVPMFIFVIGVLAKYTGLWERAERGFSFLISAAALYLGAYVFGETWTSGSVLGGWVGASAVSAMEKVAAVLGLLGWILVIVAMVLIARDLILPPKY